MSTESVTPLNFIDFQSESVKTSSPNTHLPEQKIAARTLAHNEISSNSITESQRRLADFKHIFNSPELTKQFNEFLKNVFMQLDEKKFHHLITEILDKNLSYEETYQELFSRIQEAKSGPVGHLISQLKSLKVIKDVLSTQIKGLLCPNAKIQCYAEIGYPGRLIRPIENVGIQISGKKIAITEGEKPTDYIEAGFPRPNDQHVVLNYDPLTNHIEKGSLELVTCPIGLHHVPTEKLPSFVKSVGDVIKPGGSFILRDHDVVSRDLEALANVVHSVFNAATGETLKTEINEERNFRDLTHWTTLLEANGFKREEGRLVQNGDPTENALIRFTKKAQTPEDRLIAFETELKLSKKGFACSQHQTYNTTVEWHLVHTAKEYANHLKTDKIHNYPYFKHIKVLWSTFIDSYRESRKAGAKINSEMMLNVFMLVSTTFELAFRGMVYSPLSLRKKSNTTAVAAINTWAQISNEYAEFLNTTPFCLFPYMQKIKEMWKIVNNTSENKFLNYYIATAMTIEFAAKAFVCLPMASVMQNYNPGKINLVVLDPKSQVNEYLDDRITITKSDQEIKTIEIPRYLEFRDIVCKLAKEKIKITSIAGQKNIQLKVKVEANEQNDNFLSWLNVLGEIPILTESKHKYVRLDVDVPDLTSVVESLEDQGAEITYIHDFWSED